MGETYVRFGVTPAKTKFLRLLGIPHKFVLQGNKVYELLREKGRIKINEQSFDEWAGRKEVFFTEKIISNEEIFKETISDLKNELDGKAYNPFTRSCYHFVNKIKKRIIP